MRLPINLLAPFLAATTLISPGCVGAHHEDLVPGFPSLSGKDLNALVKSIHQEDPTPPNNNSQTDTN